MMKCYRNLYILILFLVCLNSVHGFTDNNGEYILQKSILGAKIFQGNSSDFNLTTTILAGPVGNKSDVHGEICFGWYCIQPSEGTAVVEVIEDIIGGVGVGGCPSGYQLVLYEGSYYCADGKTLIRFRQRRYNLYLMVTLFFLFFLFKRKKKKRKQWSPKR